MVNTMIMYQLQLTPHNISLNASLNYTHNQTNNNITQYVGPVLGCNVSFLDKTLRLNTSVSFNQGFVNNLTDLFVGNLRLSLSYTLKEKHYINSLYRHHMLLRLYDQCGNNSI